MEKSRLDIIESDLIITEGPLTERGELSAGLDYYKPSMSQFAYDKERDIETTFTFHNRGSQRLLDYVDPVFLKERFNFLRQCGFSESEIDYLGSLKNSNNEQIFKPGYLNYIKTSSLPEVNVRYDQGIDDIAIDTTGPWALATFWETIVMSEVNEAYFEGYIKAHQLNPLAVYAEGDRRLSDKIAILKENPDIRFIDFGTRRHFSLRWQKHVLERLLDECSVNLIGTSNVALAKSLGIRAVGTLAHEVPMVYAGLADARGQDIRLSPRKFINDWYDYYGEESSIVPTDTFTTDFFLKDITYEQAMNLKGLRQDSGDPVEIGEKILHMYQRYGINPRTKVLVPSDGLNIGQILKIQNHFSGRVESIPFGWGTNLTNDLGLTALNVVMKATHVRDMITNQSADLVKMSDDTGKHTGPTELVDRYEVIFR